MKNDSSSHVLLQQNKLLSTCATCLFNERHDDEGRDNCLRFARFVDHALNATSRDCDYWTPAAVAQGDEIKKEPAAQKSRSAGDP